MCIQISAYVLETVQDLEYISLFRSFKDGMFDEMSNAMFMIILIPCSGIDEYSDMSYL
jgi:hypothetical protein